MQIIIKGRGQGKTTDLINLSYERGGYIITATHKDAYRIAQQAKDMGLHILFPMTYREAAMHSLPSNIREVYVDDLDRILPGLFSMKIEAITMTANNTAIVTDAEVPEGIRTVGYSGKVLREMRHKRDETLVRASKGIGMSVSFLSELERDNAYPSIPQLSLLAKYYKCQFTIGAVGYDRIEYGE